MMKPAGFAVVERFRGWASSDEPRATLAAKEVLEVGGNAADAAAALYLALAVTLPSTAGLGGGGVCMVWDPATNRGDTLEFLARNPSAVGAVPAAVPASARGMQALQAKYGRMRWAQVVAPAESLARFGVPVSRALARDLADAEPSRFAEPEAVRLFTTAGGRPLAEGAMLVQPELAETLARLRTNLGGMNSGPFAARFATAAQAVGAAVTVEDLDAMTPLWEPPLILRDDELFLHLPRPPVLTGVEAGQMWRMLNDSPRFRRADAAEKLHLLAEATTRATADQTRWVQRNLTSSVPLNDLIGEARGRTLMGGYSAERRSPPAADGAAPRQPPTDPESASFVTLDGNGQAVACSVTNYGLFGSRHMARGTGVFLGGLPDAAAYGPQTLATLLVVRQRDGQFLFGGAASGGAAAGPTLLGVALRTVISRRSLEEAIAAPRVFPQGSPDVLQIENGAEAEARRLSGLGYNLVIEPAIARVNAIYCPEGLPGDASLCQWRSDPRGAGFADFVKYR